MAKAIIMPKFEMSQEVGVIVEWLKSEGDVVKRGEPILTVETDKVTMDVESPGKGVLAGLRGEPGDTIPVTETIGYILSDGESIPIPEPPKIIKSVESKKNVAPVSNSNQKVTNGKPGKTIIMPKFEMSQEFGVIVEWLKSEGDEVKRGEPILTVETDKVTMDVESPGKGVLAGLRGEVGDRIPVTETIGWVLGEGQIIPTTDDSMNFAARVVERDNFDLNPLMIDEINIDVKVTPVALNLANADNVSLTGVIGSGRDGKIMKQDVLNVAVSGVNDKVRATPAAKHVASEAGINLTAVTGTGPKGRIQTDDVAEYIEMQAISSKTAVSAAQTVTAPVGSEMILYAGMRKRIGDNLQGSYQTAPHVFLKMKIEMSAFNELRASMNTKADKNGLEKISITALLTKMIAATLKMNPMINSTLHEDKGVIELKKQINVGVAVALNDGLIVPVVKDADLKGMSNISNEIKDLAGRAKSGKLTLEDITGGTFTISNLGPYGIAEFTSIINPGQSAILAIGTTTKEVQFDEDSGEIKNVPVMNVTLSIDHRVIDGAVGAKFLNDLKEIIETPGMLFW